MATYRKLPFGQFQAKVRLMGMKPLYATFPTKTKAKHWGKIVEEDAPIARRLTREELTIQQLVTVESTDGRLIIELICSAARAGSTKRPKICCT